MTAATFVYLPSAMTWLNLANVAAVDRHGEGDGLTIITLAPDNTERGYPSSMQFDVDGADAAILARSLRLFTLNNGEVPV